MDDFNDLFFFTAVVRYNGFSAAARATGIEKTRLSRRVAELERRVGARLLQRSTRKLALTDAGEQFFARCSAAVEGAQAAYDSLARLQTEPSGIVRLSCPVVLAQSYLAPILPAFLEAHPKVRVVIEATNSTTDLIEERFDLALRARAQLEDEAALVTRSLGAVARILVASPQFLARHGRPGDPGHLREFATVSRASDLVGGAALWKLSSADGRSGTVETSPRLATDDFRVQLEAATFGAGVALLPEIIASGALRAGTLERVLSDWSAPGQLIQLVYLPPRGMLPSVRSLIDYLTANLPATIASNPVADRQ